MIKKFPKYIFIFFIIFFAIEASTNQSIASVTASPFSDTSTYTDPTQFIKDVYDWGIGIVGLLAFIRLVWGGVLYMVSGAVDTKKKATGIMTDAIVGLLLALSSYLIINIINPKLIQVEPISTSTSGCFTSEEISSYTSNGFQCTSSDDPSCSDHPNTSYFDCKLLH